MSAVGVNIFIVGRYRQNTSIFDNFLGDVWDVSFWSYVLTPQLALLDFNLSQQGYPDVLRRFATGTRGVSATDKILMGQICFKWSLRWELYSERR